MEIRDAGRFGGRLGTVALVAILLLALGLRLGEAWGGRAPVYDAQGYAAIAANLDRGEGFTLGAGATQPASNYSPGLPLAVAVLYEATGGVHERLARVALAVLGTLSVLFSYLIARRLQRPPGSPHHGAVDSTTAALVAAALVAIYPALLEYQGMLMGEPLAATLLSGAVLAALWAWDGPRVGGGAFARWTVPGLALGALALVRPEYLGIAVLVAAAVAARRLRTDWRASLLRAGALLAGLVVVIGPWTVRNAVALDRFVPISTGGGQVLFAGTYLPSGGDPERVGAEVVARHPELFAPGDARRLRLEQILARLAAQRHPGIEADEALAKMGRQQLQDDVSEHPVEYAAFVAEKVWRLWGHGPRDVMREPGWEALHWLLLGSALLGLALLAWRRRWEALLLGIVFLGITAISALLVASPRRVLVLVPLLAACGSVGLAWLAGTLAGVSTRRRHATESRQPGPPADRPGSLSAP